MEFKESARGERVGEQINKTGLQASANHTQQPRMGKDKGFGCGGDFEVNWRRGKGAWVRTVKRPGRSLIG